MSYTLFPFQRDAIDAAHQTLREGCRSFVIVAPTGAGKTIIATRFILERGGNTLIILPKDDLLENAKRALLRWHPEAEIGLIKGSRNEYDSQFVLASIQSLSQPHRLRKLPHYFHTIVIDEAQHAVASQYLSVLRHFQTSCLLGLTATPERLDKVGLDNIFEKIAYGHLPGHATMEWLVANHYLAKPEGVSVDLDIDWDEYEAPDDSDLSPDVAASVMESSNWIEHVLKAYQRYGPQRHGVGFVSTIAMAEDVTERMRALGLSVECLHGKQTLRQRRQILKRLESNQTALVWSVDWLIEGTDVPIIDLLLMCRRTLSLRVLQQMLGRGLRTHPKKKNCLVLDFVGLNRRFDLDLQLHAAPTINGDKIRGKVISGDEAGPRWPRILPEVHADLKTTPFLLLGANFENCYRFLNNAEKRSVERHIQQPSWLQSLDVEESW